MKNQQEINEFRKLFSFLKDKHVVLYGTGQYTEMLLQELRDFHFTALMDQGRTGQCYCGLRVLSAREVVDSGCEAVIIAANLSVAPVIYQRIAHLEHEGIAVYYMNGRRPVEARWKSIQLPWPWEMRQLLDAAREYDVISFDLFDTLIMRKCLLPEEVFSLVGRRLGLSETFPACRQEAEKTLYHSGDRFHSLEGIYRQLGLPETVRQAELDAELEMILPRTDMVELYHQLLAEGRQVVITSDMYLSSSQLEPLLRKCGIEGAVLYVSNEQKASKHLGTLFHQLQADFHGRRILHIGDNPRCDVKNAKLEGVSALQIAGAAAQMERCGLGGLRTAIHNDTERHMYELFAQRCFAPAFRQNKASRILISDQRDLGYLFFGPLAVGYLAWLVEEVQQHSIDRLLFVSRDGWLFYQLYERLREQYGGLPEANYFLTSRRCAGTASIRTEEDIRFIFEDVCYSRSMRLGEMLEKAYGISRAGEPAADRLLGDLGAGEAWSRIQRHKVQILEHAAVERAAYLRYIDSLGIAGQRIGMMNFVGRGVTQRCLERILEQDLTGFYFALEYDAARILSKDTAAFSWYPESISTHVGRSMLAEQLLLGETVFSAPHGALVAFSEDGAPVYEPTGPERTALVNACHQGIAEYLKDILQMEQDIDGLKDTVELADAIFGLLGNELFVLSKDIKSGLQMEDRFQ